LPSLSIWQEYPLYDPPYANSRSNTTLRVLSSVCVVFSSRKKRNNFVQHAAVFLNPFVFIDIYLNRLLVLGLIATAAVFVGRLVTTLSLQEVEAVRCDRSVIALCGVYVNANVIGQDVSQRGNQQS
jgi:hypothetical protein